MTKRDWKKELGWGVEQLTELRSTGYAYIQQGKYDIALSFFEALSVLDSSEPYDLQTLGALYVELNQPSKALPCLDAALKKGADHTPTLMNLTKAFFMLGKKEEGLRLCQILQEDKNKGVANMAKALLLAFGPMRP